MNLNELYNNYGAKKNSKRIGRGIGSGKGKTGGRGVKGQKARAGVAIKGFEGGQTPLKKRLPKRGFNCPSKQDVQIVNISQIENMIEKNNLNNSITVNRELLLKFGLIKKMNKPIKILSGSKNIKSRLSIHVHSYSKSAKENVENYGGKAIYKK